MQIDEKISKIESDIEAIKSNHLFHIEKDMLEVKSRLEKFDERLWAIVFLILAGAALPIVLSRLGLG